MPTPRDRRSRSTGNPASPAIAALFGLMAFTASPVPAPAQGNDPPAVPRAQPVDTPATPRPAAIPPPPASAPVARPVDPSKIRDADNDSPREDLITYADLLFSRKEWKLAAQQYQTFLREHPASPNRPAAWYRLGECYLASDQKADARTSFGHLIDRFSAGPYVGAAAYRLGTDAYEQGKHAEAAQHFATAASEAPAPELRLQARYYHAVCLQKLDRNAEAIAAYREVIQIRNTPDADGGDPPPASVGSLPSPEENPFAEVSALAIARLLTDADDTEAAYAEYLALSEAASSEGVRHESLARAGLLAAQLGNTGESNRLLDAVLASDAGDQWKGTAQVALIFNLYAAEDYEKVVGVYTQGIDGTPEDVRPKMLMMVANSMRLTGDYEAATAVYRIIEDNFRKLPLATEAVFRKLQCLGETGDTDLVNEIDRFIKSQRELDDSSPFIDLAALMKGEWHFQRSNWEPAAEAYASVRHDQIPEKYRAARLYKLGWSQSESDQPNEAIASLTRFIDEHPENPFVPSALAKRAATLQAVENVGDALDDYQRIVSEFPDCEQLEFALEQIAYIRNVQRKVPEMIAAYQALLDRFPETAGAAEANFYIGGGYYEQKDYARALEPLRRSRELAEEKFFQRATEVIVLALFRLEDIEQLATEVDLALSSEPPLKVPIPVLNYLGEATFQRADYRSSERFFSAASTPATPAETPSAVWDYLGRARHEIGLYGGAVLAFDHYLSIVRRPTDRAEGYINKGHAQLGKKDYEDADATAREALKIVHQGKLNARARLLRGDIAFARGDHEEAAREYFVTSQIFVNDPEITPQATAKAARAYRAAGNIEKADELDAQLSSDYPNYRLPTEE